MFQTKSEQTLNYYNKNAKEYAKSTLSLNLTSIHNKFLSCLKPNSHILDIGCGPGRDSYLFKNKGHHVTSYDPSSEMIKIAHEKMGVEVEQKGYMDLDQHNHFDAIWAMSSMLHIPIELENKVWDKVIKALKINGILYASFKYGENEEFKHSKIFRNHTPETLKQILKKKKNIIIEEIFITDDSFRDYVKWTNILLRKLND